MAGAKDMWKKFLSSMNRGLTANPSITLFIVISFVIHLIDVFSNFRNTSFRIFAYLILAITAWLSLFKDQENPGVIDIAKIKFPLILSSIAIFAPYLGGILPFLGSSQAFQTAIIFFPAWVLFLCFAMGQNWFITLCRWVIVALLLFLFLPTFINSFINDLRIGDIETGINVQQTISNTMRDLSYGVNSFVKNIGKAWKDAWNSLIKTATGDYYSGEVDKYENEPVGVYLEDLQAADSKFFEGEKITVWAVLKAKTLDKEININVSCYSKEGDKKVGGNITPQNEFNIATEEEEYLDCTFDNINPGKMDVTFNAEFNFETMAYLKTYFMDKESLRALTREGIDVFDHYKISHVNPIAIYTNGPVGIGMKTAEPLPVGVYSNQENIPFFFGITIENNWEGTIKKITGLEVQVHDSLELTNCDQDFEFKENEDDYNIYSLVPDKRTEDIKTGKFYSIQCRLNPTDPKSLLGNEPITTRYFRVTISYVYELEKSVPVEVEKVEDYKSPEEAMTEENKIEELKSQSEINEICKNISKCKDYDANYYNKLGFNDQTWCDTNPCNLDCYSAFEKSGDEISYDSCEKCPDIEEELKDYTGLIKDCGIYLSEDYCKKDSCEFSSKHNLICEWQESVNVCARVEGVEKIDDWEKYSDENKKNEIKIKIKGAASEIGVPTEIALAVAFIESEYNQDRTGKYGEIGVMQVRYSTSEDPSKKSYCQMYCSFIGSESDLYDLNNNIKCGLTILNKLHEYYMNHPSEFRENVDVRCDDPILRDKYLSYVDKGAYASNWDMALRAYNGFGCSSGNVNYVEDVIERANVFKN